MTWRRLCLKKEENNDEMRVLFNRFLKKKNVSLTRIIEHGSFKPLQNDFSMYTHTHVLHITPYVLDVLCFLFMCIFSERKWVTLTLNISILSLKYKKNLLALCLAYKSQYNDSWVAQWEGQILLFGEMLKSPPPPPPPPPLPPPP